jgi:hypothetical protein
MTLSAGLRNSLHIKENNEPRTATVVPLQDHLLWPRRVIGRLPFTSRLRTCHRNVINLSLSACLVRWSRQGLRGWDGECDPTNRLLRRGGRIGHLLHQPWSAGACPMSRQRGNRRAAADGVDQRVGADVLEAIGDFDKTRVELPAQFYQV